MQVCLFLEAFCIINTPSASYKRMHVDKLWKSRTG